MVANFQYVTTLFTLFGYLNHKNDSLTQVYIIIYN